MYATALQIPPTPSTLTENAAALGLNTNDAAQGEIKQNKPEDTHSCACWIEDDLGDGIV